MIIKKVVLQMRFLGIVSGHFLQKDFTNKKAHKMQTSDFHSDAFTPRKH